MTDHAARLARILETHPDVVHVDGATEALIKRDELLVLGAHADEVHDKARRWVDSREDFGRAGRDAAAAAGRHRRRRPDPHACAAAPRPTGG